MVNHWRGGSRLRKGKTLSLQLTKRGYIKVQLSRDGKAMSRMAHCLVCPAFNGPRPSGKEVAHIDGNGTNNRADNLAWKTHAENERDKWLHGTVAIGLKNGKHTKPECTPRGERAGQSDLTDDQVILIRKLIAEGVIGAHRLAKLLRMSKSAISAIGDYKTWRHVA